MDIPTMDVINATLDPHQLALWFEWAEQREEEVGREMGSLLEGNEELAGKLEAVEMLP